MFESVRKYLTQIALFSAMLVLVPIGEYLGNQLCTWFGLLCAISLFLNFSIVEALCKKIERKIKEKFKQR